MVVNPVIPGFHPDPSVCQVGDDYYLACSSFEYYPGVPIFHSRDLTAWTQIGNALDRPSQLRLVTAPSSGGIYAPTLRHHDGLFLLITTNVSDRGHFIVTARDPAGPWSDPIVVEGLPGVDPDLAWDETGTCWCTYATFGAEAGTIMQVPIDPLRGKILDAPRPLWSGTGLAAPEAPHLYRIDGNWYLLIAEGGTARGHAVSAARAPTATGPFQGCPTNPILSHRSTSSPIQNTGHADLVRAPDGSWQMLLLGVRPRGVTPGYHVLGRETFLTPVRWVDGWPQPAPVSPGGPAAGVHERDHFDGTTLGPQWLSIRHRPPHAYSLDARPSWLTLHAGAGSLDDPLPTFAGRRQQHTTCRVRVRMDPGSGCGGLAVRLDEHHHYRIEATADNVRCLARIGPLAQPVATCPVDADGPIVLGIDIVPGPASDAVGTPPDVVRLGVEEEDGRFTPLAELDGRYLSTEVAGGYTGRVIGVYAAEGVVAFDWYEYTGAAD
ncbi:glycoside hydrolase family 43 protein [Microbispora rosea]|uniref:glycoside hydrolase family 43 protein n=1 Tax=Microbispora rosea TaxID=58117 RepID=UPI003D8EF9FE